jgi:hypothetical protein
VSRKDQLFRIIAQLDDHFCADDCSREDADRWKELKLHVARTLGALFLVEMTLRKEHDQGIPLAAEIGHKLKKYALWGLGEKDAP